MVRKLAVNWKEICHQTKVNDETGIHWLDRRIVAKQLDIKPTYHYVQNQGELMRKSRENGQKPQFGQLFDDFVAKYLQIAIFSEKQISFKLKAIFSTNIRPKIKKIVWAVFEKNIKVFNFGLIWRPFCEYLQIKDFFQK